MRLGCWAVLAVAFAAGCGGKSEAHRRPTEKPETACVTSFACPEAKRCESGACVPDDRCPGEREPQLFFEAEAGSTFTWSTTNRYLTTFGDREFLVVNEADASGAPSEITRFHELSSGREMIFEHGPGYSGCGGVPARCTVSSAAETTIAEVELGEDRVTLVEETLFRFIGIDFLFTSDADYRAGRVVVTAGTRVEIHELGHLPPVASVDFVNLRPSWPVEDADGRNRRATAYRQALPPEPAEFAVAALENGAVPERLYAGPPGRTYLFGLPDDDGEWFVVRDEVGGEAQMLVYRGSTEGGAFLGSFEGSWGATVPIDYLTGRRRLERGPSVYAYRCSADDGCDSHRIALDPVGIEEVARAALPEPHLVDYLARPLACGGADVFVVTSEGTDSPTRFWSVRIPGRDGFP